MIKERVEVRKKEWGRKKKFASLKSQVENLQGLPTCSSRPLNCPYKGLNDEGREIK